GDGTGARIDNGWGRALGRDHLDTLLLQRAAAAGAHIWQPWSVVGLVNQEDGYVCQAVSRESGQSSELRARIVVAAHGSWEPGPAHIKQFCRGAREALEGARMEDDWLSAGPIRPGIRHCGLDGIFLVGNAAGEAHPVVAEGIGMAMQSAWLLCECLTAGPVG